MLSAKIIKAEIRLESFCGHATIATFAALKLLGMLGKQQLTIETKAGPLNIHIKEDGLFFMEQNCPAYFDALNPDIFADCIEKDFINRDCPIQIVSTGLNDIMFFINSREQLKAVYKII